MRGVLIRELGWRELSILSIEVIGVIEFRVFSWPGDVNQSFGCCLSLISPPLLFQTSIVERKPAYGTLRKGATSNRPRF